MKSAEVHLCDVTFRPVEQLLQRGAESIQLRNKSMEVLTYLAGQLGETVSKDELIESVWHDRTASEESLVQCIADIRRAIGDRDKKTLQTIPSQGYRLVGKAKPARKMGGYPVLAISLALIACALAVTLIYAQKWNGRSAAVPTIAVLPFDELSVGENNSVLNAVLSEGIITELARYPQFKVISKNSSFQFGEGLHDVSEIGAKLGADYLLDGSQYYDGETLNVSVHLIDTQTGTHAFSSRMDRGLGDIFSIQDDIVRQIASAVGRSIQESVVASRGLADASALLLGLQARRHMRHFSKTNWQKAFELEQKSVSQYPSSSWGHIGMALSLRNGANWGWIDEPEDLVLTRAEDHAKKAIELEPENYMAHYASARVHATRGNTDKAIFRFQRAIELNPSDSAVLIGFSTPLLYSGQDQRALDILYQAKAIDPLHDDWLYWQLGWAFWQIGQCKKGLEAMTAMANPPVSSRRMLAALYSCLDDKENATKALAEYLSENPNYTMQHELQSHADGKWTAPGAVDRWIADMRFAGLSQK